MNDTAVKMQIRDAVRNQRRLLTPEQISGASDILTEQFLSVGDKDLRALLSSASTVAVYSAVNGELPCDGIAKFYYDNGRTVCYPRVKGDNMDFYEVTDPDTQLVKGSYGIREPKEGCRKIYPGDIDLMIVPAVAYNDEGLRLGQGGGYYDRYLAAAEKKGRMPFTLGVCYDFQIYSALPVEKHDRAVDCVMCVFTGEEIR